MVEISLKDVKNLQLDLLRDIDSFCEQHGLKYYLCGGTLLGSLRHSGYIPWDDDIDIIMPREDYIIFNELYNLKNSDYKVRSIYTVKNWDTTFAIVENTKTLKIYNDFLQKHEVGVCLDVFPTDGSPNNLYARKIYWYTLNFLSKIITLSNQRFTISKHYVNRETNFSNIKKYFRTAIKFMLIPIARCINLINLSEFVNFIASRYKIEDSKYIGVSTFPHYGYKECVEAEGFLKIERRLFEGEYFNTPYNYDEYLSNLYGDYMKLPPKEKQVSHHDFKAYWKD